MSKPLQLLVGDSAQKYIPPPRVDIKTFLRVEADEMIAVDIEAMPQSWRKLGFARMVELVEEAFTRIVLGIWLILWRIHVVVAWCKMPRLSYAIQNVGRSRELLPDFVNRARTLDYVSNVDHGIYMFCPQFLQTLREDAI